MKFNGKLIRVWTKEFQAAPGAPPEVTHFGEFVTSKGRRSLTFQLDNPQFWTAPLPIHCKCHRDNRTGQEVLVPR